VTEWLEATPQHEQDLVFAALQQARTGLQAVDLAMTVPAQQGRHTLGDLVHCLRTAIAGLEAARRMVEAPSVER
jgi:hypothetical protein